MNELRFDHCFLPEKFLSWPDKIKIKAGQVRNRASVAKMKTLNYFLTIFSILGCLQNFAISQDVSCSYCQEPIIKFLYLANAARRFPASESVYRTSLSGGHVRFMSLTKTTQLMHFFCQDEYANPTEAEELNDIPNDRLMLDAGNTVTSKTFLFMCHNL